MHISSLQISNAPCARSQTPFRPARSITKRLDNYLNNYDMSFERIAKVRAKILAKASRIHSFDEALVLPEQYKSRSIRALIHLAKHTEEIAESVSDISGLLERLTRNLISSGEKSDLALVIASAIGRVISGQLNLVGMAVHKVAGAALYALSSAFSILALGLIRSGLGEQRTDSEIALAKTKSNFDLSAYTIVADKLLASKECLLDKLIDIAGEPTGRFPCAIHRWVKYMSRHRSSIPPHMHCKRKTHCSYIWNNLHQYGPVTRALMHFAYGTFQGINKLLVSYDKHLGTAISHYLLRKKIGGVLGCRIGMTLSVGSAAAISIPLSTVIISISTIGAMACAVALVALILAKLNVWLGNDWQGNIQRSPHSQVLGNVTPT